MKCAITATLLAVLGCAVPAVATDYDLVILNGRVIDPETMLDGKFNVGIKDGRVKTITPGEIAGAETIDATGLVVAPGFIDLHFHALDGLSLKLAALDGVTTGMDLEAGAIHVADWYAAKDKSGWPLNYGTGVSQEMTRTRVHDPEVDTSGWHDATSVFELRAAAVKKDGVPGWSVTRSNLEQFNQILAYIDEELRQGAISLASTIGYMSEGVTTFEMYKTQEVAANYGRALGAHVRFHGNPSNPEGTLGTSELLANAMALDAPFSINHDNEYGWWENEEKLQKARAQGYNVWSEYYPYSAASTAISSDFFAPAKFKILSGGRPYEETLYDPIQDKFLTQEDWEKTSKEDPGRTIFAFNPNRDKNCGHPRQNLERGSRKRCAADVHDCADGLLAGVSPGPDGARGDEGTGALAGGDGRRYHDLRSRDRDGQCHLQGRRAGPAHHRHSVCHCERRACRTR